MALVACPECGQQVSTAAKACPACGYPVAESTGAVQVAQVAPDPVTEGSPNDLLAEVRPSWWRYFWWLVFAWLIIPFFVAWIKRSATLLRVYRGRITLTRGIFSKCERELFMKDIRSIDIDQTFLGRLVDIGDISIASAASADAVEFVEGVPDPQHIRDLIIAQRQAS